jgi:hypothetical protein
MIQSNDAVMLLSVVNEPASIVSAPIETPGTNPKEKPEVEPDELPEEEPGIQPGKRKPGKKEDDDDDDDDDDPYTETEIGDDPDTIKKKTTIM